MIIRGNIARFTLPGGLPSLQEFFRDTLYALPDYVMGAIVDIPAESVVLLKSKSQELREARCLFIIKTNLTERGVWMFEECGEAMLFWWKARK